MITVHRRRTIALLAALLLPASGAAPWASPPATKPKVDVKVLVTPPGAPVPAGARGESRLLLSPPEGIKINRYPPVTLKLKAPDGIVLDAEEMKQGSLEPIEDPKDFPFETIEPITVGFQVAGGARPGTSRVEGKINFVYCVASSGYCERVTRDVAFDVTVAPRRAN